ncbi:MAG TPA: MFS transporter [Candidatus Acidoferrales bacterium]|nr:MFS transporter [Candidatus Acidoferrales bacterium]
MVSESSPLSSERVSAAAEVPTRVRWTVVALVAFVTGLTYVDRLNLGIVAKNFQDEFRFTSQTMGWILGAFSLGYAWFHVPGGWLADRFGARRVLAGAIIWFSVFTALTTIASSIPVLSLAGAAWSFAVVRFLMGVGESAAFPVGNKMMGNWLGPKERALGTSIFLAGVGVAGIFAPVLITRMEIGFGWRAPFLGLGLIGIVAGLFCYVYVTDRPDQNPRMNSSELALIAGSEGTESAPAQKNVSPRIRVPWGKVFSNTSIWALMVSHFCLVYPLYIFFTWFFIYLVKVRGVTVSQASFWGSAPFLANIIMVPFWGWLSDRSVHKLGMRSGRRLTAWLGIGGSALLLWSGSHTASNIAALLELTVAAGFNFAASAILYTTCTDISKKYAGSISGTMATFGSLGGAASPVVTAFIATKFGWTQALDFAALVTLVSGAAWFFIDASKLIE